ncbi:TPA: hypothetical protein N0F65_007492 [Lagenidium giganteum]|uniref:Right handed beta helix domain-containing protein n=1 Tax=Lagenidium giganteum TaxID=4803 RepID=A0AAV2ZS65_9STRA|nr:TPA: hypothetical protein N0F65_007492 [Lagenidium giganteum]
MIPGVYQEASSNAITFASSGVHDVQVIAPADGVTIDRAYSGQFFVFGDGAGNVSFTGVRFINDGTFAVGFTNCTFEHHRIESSGFAARGGVGTILAGAPRFTNCRFIDNWAGIAGAFYVAGNANPVFDDCEFADSGCYPAGWGGVIVPEGNSTGTWTRCIFRNNTCDYGGAIDDGQTSASKFVGCTFENNFSPFYGGAYYGYGAARTQFDGCVFRNNRVAKGADGQDFFLSSTVVPLFRNSRFEAGDIPQSASSGACGRIQDSSTVIMENCTVSGYVGIFGVFELDINSTGTFDSCVFANNSATRGGVILAVRPVKIRSCQFLNNSANEGGAIYIGGPYKGSFMVSTIENCVFAGNSASSSGGAIYMAGRALVQLSQSTFTNNAARDVGGGAVYVASSASLFSTEDSFVSNTAPVGGAIWSAATVSMMSATMANNRAQNSENSANPYSHGGGIYLVFANQSSDLETWNSTSCASDQVMLQNLTMSSNAAVDGGGGAIFLDGAVPACMSTQDAVCQGCQFSSNNAVYGPDVASGIAGLAAINATRVWQLMEPVEIDIGALDMLNQRVLGNHPPFIVTVDVVATGSTSTVSLVSTTQHTLRSGLAKFPDMQLQENNVTKNTEDTPLPSSSPVSRHPVALLPSRLPSVRDLDLLAAMAAALANCVMVWAARHSKQIIRTVGKLLAGVVGSAAQAVLQVLDLTSNVITLVILLAFDVGLGDSQVLVQSVYTVGVVLAVVPSLFLLRATIRLVQFDWHEAKAHYRHNIVMALNSPPRDETNTDDSSRVDEMWQRYYRSAFARQVARPGDENKIELAPGIYRELTPNAITFASSGVHDVLATAKASGVIIDRAYSGQLFVFGDGAGIVRFIGLQFANGGLLEKNVGAGLVGGLMTFLNGRQAIEFFNCTFEHHRIEAPGYTARGAVGNIVAGAPRFKYCRFLDNWAGIAGAFYVAGDAAPIFEDCEFANSGCYTFGWGGVIVPEGNSTGTWTRCTFRNNSCDYGGAIDDGQTSASRFVDCTFEDNFASLYGGAYYGYGKTTTQFDGCLFRNNRVPKGGNGQDFFLSSSVMIVFRNSIFEAGDAPQSTSGGACGRIQDSSHVVMENCTVSGYIGYTGVFEVDINSGGSFNS